MSSKCTIECFTERRLRRLQGIQRKKRLQRSPTTETKNKLNSTLTTRTSGTTAVQSCRLPCSSFINLRSQDPRRQCGGFLIALETRELRLLPAHRTRSMLMHLNLARPPRLISLQQEGQQEHQGSGHCKQPIDINIRESLTLCVQQVVHFGERRLLRGMQIKTGMGQPRC
jgi:hypothetical protein